MPRDAAVNPGRGGAALEPPLRERRRELGRGGAEPCPSRAFSAPLWGAPRRSGPSGEPEGPAARRCSLGASRRFTVTGCPRPGAPTRPRASHEARRAAARTAAGAAPAHPRAAGGAPRWCRPAGLPAQLTGFSRLRISPLLIQQHEETRLGWFA